MIVAFAALIHSGFSLGTSMLVLLSGHSIIRKRSHARLLSLTGGFVAGSFAMILLLFLALTYLTMITGVTRQPLTPLILGTLTMLAGVWVLFFYHRRGSEGTALWLPRSFARYLTERTAHTKTTSESFVLGGASVIYELPVTAWLFFVAASSVTTITDCFQIPAAIGYALIAVAALLVVFMLIGGGHTVASLTRFRARHKRFLQVLIGASMILLGAALFWNTFYSSTSAGGAWPW